MSPYMSMLLAYALLVFFTLVGADGNATTAVPTGVARVHRYRVGLDKSVDALLRKTGRSLLPPSAKATRDARPRRS